MKFPRRVFLHLAAMTAQCRPSPVSLARSPIRRGQCDGSLGIRPVAVLTL